MHSNALQPVALGSLTFILFLTLTENELQKVNYDVFKVESILEERTNEETGGEEVFVKWVGWPEKYNQRIDKSLIVRDYTLENKERDE